MPRYSQAYSGFKQGTEEVNLLRKKAAQLERSPNSLRHGPEIRALCRAAVVLLSSHIEAYIKELGEQTLDAIYRRRVSRERITPRFFYHASKVHLDAIREAPDPDQIADRVFKFVEADSAFWSKFGAINKRVASDEFSKGFANPKFDKIKKYLNRFGYQTFKRDFYRTLGKDSVIIHTGIDNIVNARNQIAHGDTDLTKTPHDISEMINHAIIFCRTTDEIYCDWCRDNLCTLRK